MPSKAAERAAFLDLLAEHPDWSTRKLAEAVGVSHTQAGAWRKAAASREPVPTAPHGRSAPREVVPILPPVENTGDGPTAPLVTQPQRTRIVAVTDGLCGRPRFLRVPEP